MAKTKLKGCVLQNIFVLILFTSNFLKLFEETKATEIGEEFDYTRDSSTESTKMLGDTTQKGDSNENFTDQDWTPFHSTYFNYSTSFHKNYITSTTPSTSEVPSTRKVKSGISMNSSEFTTSNLPEKYMNIHRAESSSTIVPNKSGYSEKFMNVLSTGNKISTTDINVHETSSLYITDNSEDNTIVLYTTEKPLTTMSNRGNSEKYSNILSTGNKISTTDTNVYEIFSLHITELASTTVPNSSGYSEKNTNIIHRSEIPSITLSNKAISEEYTNILSTGNKISITDANVDETSSLHITEIPSTTVPNVVGDSEEYTNLLHISEKPSTTMSNKAGNSEKYTNMLSTGNKISIRDANIHETSSLHITEIPSTTVPNVVGDSEEYTNLLHISEKPSTTMSNKAGNSEKYTNMLSTGNKISITDANIHETSSLHITEIPSTTVPNVVGDSEEYTNLLHISEKPSTTMSNKAGNSEKYTNMLSTENKISIRDANIHETSSLHITEIPSTTVLNVVGDSEEYTNLLQISEKPSTTMSNKAGNSEKYTNMLSTGNKISIRDANIHETSSLHITEIPSTTVLNVVGDSEEYTNLLHISEKPSTTMSNKADANIHETSSLHITEIPSTTVPNVVGDSEEYTNLLHISEKPSTTMSNKADANIHETSSLHITEIPSTTVPNVVGDSEEYINLLHISEKPSTTMSNKADANIHETSSLHTTEIPSTTVPNIGGNSEKYTNLPHRSKKSSTTISNKADNSEKHTNKLSTGNTISTTDANVHDTSSMHITEIASTTVSNSEAQNSTISSTIASDITSVFIKSNEETASDTRKVTTEKFDDTTHNNFHGTSSLPAETSPENVTDSSDIYTKILSSENTVLITDVNGNNTRSTTAASEITEKNFVLPEVDFEISNVSSNSFTIRWKEPSNFTEYDFMYYYISVEDKGPKHYVRPSDIERYGRVYKYSYNESKFIEHEASPNSLYEIQVFAGNEYENGTSGIKKITTNSSYSTEPLNVTSKVEVISNHCNSTEYNSTLHLNWELPYNTKGELYQFLVEIIGSNYKHKFQVPVASNITDVFYYFPVPNLNASSEYNYTILPITVGNISGNVGIGFDETPDGCPSKPTALDIHEITSSGFSINWKGAEEYYGVILGYDIEINILGLNHFICNDTECGKYAYENTKIGSTDKFEYFSNITSFKFINGLPDYNYKVSTRSRTSAGGSEFSEYEIVTTASIASTPVRDLIVTSSGYEITEETFEYNVTLSFKKPCNTNGPFESYLIKYSGYREGYHPNDDWEAVKDLSDTNISITLKSAEYDYTFQVFVVTKDNYSSVATIGHIKTISGVPPVNYEDINYKINEENPIQIDVVLTKDIFNNSMGNVIYYAVILIPSNGSVHHRKFHHDEWEKNWPSANMTTFYFRNRSEIIQLTENNWNPFNDTVNTINICIGKSSECFLNYDLNEDTEYFIVTRGLTKNTYRDIYTSIKTGRYKSNLWLTLTSIFFFLLLIVCAIYIYSKKGQSIRIGFLMAKKSIKRAKKDDLMKDNKFKRISNANGIEEAPRHVIAIKNLVSCYNKITDDPEILKQQYANIEDETRAYKAKYVKSDFALKPENKRKNRYINILPYDENRVRLNIEEDDEMSSDYINASYIKGFSGEIEYIASQGPLEHTCRDFWKMVIQENVTVIVMVSHFIENEKEKCFKYFPRNYENLLICEDLEVKCLTELQFDTYCVRTLLVRKDIRQYSVIHLQYLDWPDFGCPSGTSNMLFFCQEVRDRIKLEKGKMIVHCSAGVGRTGTLISLDILLQAVRKKKEISIFETVLQLRKQRTHMVQTEKQYVYLHTCIKDALENESLFLREGEDHCQEHTYKNTPMNKKYLVRDFEQEISEDESAL